MDASYSLDFSHKNAQSKEKISLYDRREGNKKAFYRVERYENEQERRLMEETASFPVMDRWP
jgi:hypothetical protein